MRSAGEHLRGRTHRLRRRKRKPASKNRSDRPGDGRDQQSQRAGAIDGSFAQRKRMIHQHRHAEHAHDEGQAETDSEPLRAQENNFHQGDEYRDRRQHHRRNARRNALFGPKQTAIVEDEDEALQAQKPRTTRAGLEPACLSAAAMHT